MDKHIKLQAKLSKAKRQAKIFSVRSALKEKQAKKNIVVVYVVICACAADYRPYDWRRWESCCSCWSARTWPIPRPRGSSTVYRQRSVSILSRESVLWIRIRIRIQHFKWIRMHAPGGRSLSPARGQNPHLSHLIRQLYADKSAKL